MNTTIGTCSICGGRVTVPSGWYATIPPTPTCESCGATKAGHGPVIQMTPARPIRTFISTGTTRVADEIGKEMLK